MTSWHTEQQDGKPYCMPQCEVCGLRYDEYGLYDDKEQAATDAVDDGWQAWPDLYHTDWDCRCPQHWSVRCETCKRYVAQADRTEFNNWLFDRGDDDMRVGVCDQCLARMDSLPALELGAWPICPPLAPATRQVAGVESVGGGGRGRGSRKGKHPIRHGP